MTAFAAFAVAVAGLGVAAPAEDDEPKDRGRALLERLQQDLAAGPAVQGAAAEDAASDGGVLALPAPPDVFPTADELRGMSREERVSALEARPWEMQAARAPDGIEVDGSLDEAVWRTAIPIGDFYERETREGLPSTESTVVRILYDDENLYPKLQAIYDRALVEAQVREAAEGADIIGDMLDELRGDQP